MSRGLSRRLMVGTPRLNADMSISILDAGGAPVDLLEPSELASGGYGFWYERVVGQFYEEQGYMVEYRMRLGFMDRGVDLIAGNAHELRFVQCKLKFQPLSPAGIEHLLYKASGLVAKHRKDGRRLFFDLVVPAVQASISSRGLQRFLRYNEVQRNVRLGVVEYLPALPGQLQDLGISMASSTGISPASGLRK